MRKQVATYWRPCCPDDMPNQASQLWMDDIVKKWPPDLVLVLRTQAAERQTHLTLLLEKAKLQNLRRFL